MSRWSKLLDLLLPWRVVNRKLDTIMAKLSDLATRVTAIETTLNKVKTEVEALRDSLGDVELPAEAEAALVRLEAISKTIDDLNPDAPVP
jgi:predicted  nucleic acid-binding Zn-ribbon protein